MLRMALFDYEGATMTLTSTYQEVGYFAQNVGRRCFVLAWSRLLVYLAGALCLARNLRLYPSDFRTAYDDANLWSFCH
jgi:hypothetical protein